jgi:hypothetical protein
VQKWRYLAAKAGMSKGGGNVTAAYP